MPSSHQDSSIQNDATNLSSRNYPPSGDTTSEGGSSGEQFTSAAQRGLVEQSTEGMYLKNQIGDAYQGNDEQAYSQRHQEKEGLGQGLNPYAGSAFEDRAEAEDKLATSIVDTRAKHYSSENAKI